jgi:hypothetical protein
MSLLEQVQVLDKLGRGKKIAAVERHYGAESTVHFMAKIKTRSGETLKASVSPSAKLLV